MKYMAIIENIINVLVPLLICGLIFIYFRRRITNLEQSIDIIMKMLQTNQLNSGGGAHSHNNQENHLIDPSPDDVYVPSSDGKEIKKIEMNNLDLEETNDSDSESESESESSESESDSEPEDSESEDEKKETKPLEIEKLDNTTNIEDLTSLVTSQEEETETNNDKSEETKKVVLNEDSTKEELEKKTLNDLKKMLKEKVPDINNLSRMNKATVIENLMK